MRFETPLDGALWCASKGFHLFPLARQSKIPPSGFTDPHSHATKDETQLRRWAKEIPGCNFAVAAGETGHFVLDIDTKNGKDGNETLKPLLAEHGALPATLTVLTPSGGRHLYMAGTACTAPGKIGKGLDVQGKGRHVVAPGSVVDGKQYVVEADLAPAKSPKWLTDMAKKATKTAIPGVQREKSDRDTRAAAEFLVKNYAVKGEGERNNGVFGFAAILKEYGLPCAMALAYTLDYNLRFDAPLEPEEVETAVNSAYSKAEIVQGSKQILAGPIEFQKEEKREKFHIWKARDAQAYEALQPDVDPIIADLGEPGDFGMLIAPSKAGKTFLALGLALGLAEGTEFCGIALKKSHVLYVNLEIKGKHFVKRAVRLHAGQWLPEDLSLIHGRGCGMTVEDIVRIATREKPDVLIVDPIFPLVGDEIDQTEMKRLLANMLAICESGPLVLCVHHDKKSGSSDAELTARGSGSGVLLRGADFALFLDSHKTDADARVVSFLNRNFKPPEARAIWFNEGRFEVAHELVAEVGIGKRAGTGKSSLEAAVDAFLNDKDNIRPWTSAADLSAALRALGATKEDSRRGASILQTKGWKISKGPRNSLEITPPAEKADFLC